MIVSWYETIMKAASWSLVAKLAKLANSSIL